MKWESYIHWHLSLLFQKFCFNCRKRLALVDLKFLWPSKEAQNAILVKKMLGGSQVICQQNDVLTPASPSTISICRYYLKKTFRSKDTKKQYMIGHLVVSTSFSQRKYLLNNENPFSCILSCGKHTSCCHLVKARICVSSWVVIVMDMI